MEATRGDLMERMLQASPVRYVSSFAFPFFMVAP